jgi:TPR repeat protein
MLLKGEGTVADPERAVPLLKKAAEAGLRGPASIALADYYRSNGDQEKERAALELVVDLSGDAEATLRLAELLLKSEGTAADQERGISLLEKAAEAGLKGPAFSTLAAYYRDSGDQVNELATLERLVNLGDNPKATLRFAEMLLDGEGTAADPERAIALLEKSAAAGLKEQAFSALAGYYRGSGDRVKELAVVEQLAHLGNGEATLRLAEMLLKGEGTPANPERAIALLEETGEAGLKEPALSALADHYHLSGDEVQELATLERLVGLGAHPEAKLRLGEMLLKGEGGDADPERAVTILEETAEAGLKGPALSALADYYRGNDDKVKEVAALEQLADLGDGKAAFRLAEVLLKGEGTSADPDRAIALLEMSLKENVTPAINLALVELLAAQYRNGDALRLTVTLLKHAYVADESDALAAFKGLPENDKAAVVQAMLSDSKLYSGPQNGRLTESTIKAIAKFCFSNNVAECRNEAMPVALLETLLNQLSLGS